MPITMLPKERIPATRLVPKITLLYGQTKTGKTEKLAELEDLLEIDAEPIVSGAEMYNMMRVTVSNWGDVLQIGALLHKEKQANPGKIPYKFIALDTIDGIEDMAISYQTYVYNKGKKPEEHVGVITDLEYGRGHGYVRDQMKAWVGAFAGYCEHLILISHVRDSETTEKGINTDIVSKEISLSGKLVVIICAACDAIGYVYRDLSGNPRISFITKDINSTMGTRMKYLAGKDIEFNWKAIFDPTSEEGAAVLSRAIVK